MIANFNVPRRIGVTLAAFAVVLAASFAFIGAASPVASALPCWTCGGPPVPPPPPPPPPPPTPTLSVDMARQTPDRGSLHVVGWTAQSSSPTTPLTVRISVDGGSATSVTANVSRPDVAAAFPSYGPNHGYDVTVPASPTAQKVCVTAVHVGSGVDNTVCKTVDSVVGFNATSIVYDTGQAQITGTELDELDKVTNTNDTTVQQSTTIGGTKQLTDTEGWSDTYGVQVTVGTTVQAGVPIFANGSINVSVQGSASFVHNGSTTTQVTFTWQQPVLVPPKSEVVASVAVSRTTLVVPYTMYGNAVYASGAQAPYSINGTYTGVNSHDLQVTLSQYNLDGTPAAAPIAQPRATLLKQS